MYNVGYQVMNNLAIPNGEEPVKEQKGMGLLSRNKTSKPDPKEKDVRQRVGEYVAQIRKARMELKNG